jgi:hypothetical protein
VGRFEHVEETLLGFLPPAKEILYSQEGTAGEGGGTKQGKGGLRR